MEILHNLLFLFLWMPIKSYLNVLNQNSHFFYFHLFKLPIVIDRRDYKKIVNVFHLSHRFLHEKFL